ncbi:Aldehyde/histidinol dehydrogenase [Thamnocephalis sphaerospora]|uniref:Aldehyde/histidinol dehydrogenase n=1 Tax=Thamnocephalis sphaerospora TaxID=78915 RepID=A0A4P9XQR1_9FUNG|nr:Aldehyde/histidinol dehydrogenase [Thamnocephalis sphaerospora]|eukprot:RKP08368.1 Aldehyde/histidinol dehydrogenase [Thamnocephalis sphaerospora]
MFDSFLRTVTERLDVLGVSSSLGLWFTAGFSGILTLLFYRWYTESLPGWHGAPVHENYTLRDASDPWIINCRDPATGQSLGQARANTPEEVRAAVAKARMAQTHWKRTTFAQRRAVLKSLLNFIVEHQEEICRVACRDTGKTPMDAELGEILVTCEKLRWTINYGEKALKTESRATGIITMHKYALVEYLPLGVVSALVSWNYPFHNTFNPIISAIFAGNGIVVKTSEHVAWSVPYWASIIHECLRAHGHDPDLVQFVCGFGETGDALVRSGVDKVTFIGSPSVGKMVMRAASDSLTPCVLELGGKDCAILCADANLDQALQLLMRGVFQNCGQNCIGIERIIVHRDCYDKFVAMLSKKVAGLKMGAPLDETDVDCGAMTMGMEASSMSWQSRVPDMVDEAVQKGARLLHGGTQYSSSKYPHGQYMAPTLLVDVTTEMQVANEELFAPVMLVLPCDSDEDALRIANSTPYGLGSSIFTRNIARGHDMAQRLRAGMCNINDFAVNYLCQSLPFGGVGDSGFDRFGGVEGLRGNCLVRSMTVDRFPSLVQTGIPPVLQYPTRGAATAAAFCGKLVRMVYADSWLEKARSALGLATSA